MGMSVLRSKPPVIIDDPSDTEENTDAGSTRI